MKQEFQYSIKLPFILRTESYSVNYYVAVAALL